MSARRANRCKHLSISVFLVEGLFGILSTVLCTVSPAWALSSRQESLCRVQDSAGHLFADRTPPQRPARLASRLIAATEPQAKLAFNANNPDAPLSQGSEFSLLPEEQAILQDAIAAHHRDEARTFVVGRQALPDSAAGSGRMHQTRMIRPRQEVSK